MSGIRIGIVGLVVFLFSFSICAGGAVAQSGCVVPTFPKQVPGIEDWVCSPLVYPSSQTIGRDSAIQAETGCGIWGCPPYTWSVAGTGFSISGSNKTNNDLEKVTITADSTACGPGSITVTDSCGAKNTCVVRCTAGAWKYKGYQNAKWTTSPTCRNCGHLETITENLISGNEKWQLKPNISGKHCASSLGCLEWGNEPLPEPPCGGPQECAAGDWTCTCGAKVPYYGQYRYYKWECP